jgi:hypothetical protein
MAESSAYLPNPMQIDLNFPQLERKHGRYCRSARNLAARALFVGPFFGTEFKQCG